MIAAKLRTTTPAQCLADLVVEKLDLHPPVPVEALVREVADVKAARVRGTGLDAVLHGLNGSDRPTLLIDEDAPATRRRFTLGHEFGHLSMAWHRGTLPCLVGEPEHGDGQPQLPGTAWKMERDANQFASRLLVPRRYIEGLLQLNLGELIAEVSKAEVSAEAAILGIAPHLPVGRVLILLDYSGTKVVRAVVSDGTMHLSLPRGSDLKYAYIDRLFEMSGHQKFGGSHILWGHLKTRMDLTTTSTAWRPILTRIMEDNGLDATPAGLLWRSVTAVAAAAHNHLGHDDVRALAQRIRHAFQRRNEYAVLAEHELFNDFASSRAIAFAEPKRPT